MQLNPDINNVQLANTLTNIGFPTEILTQASIDIAKLRIAKIISARAFHNDLRLLTVIYMHQNIVQSIEVVCGDINLLINAYVPLILIGETLPNTGKKLKSREIYGVVSAGMLCSAKELGISIDDNGVHIFDFKQSKLQQTTEGILSKNHIDPETLHYLNMPILQALNPCGDIFDCEVTYNRGDLLSVLGIARELSAADCGQMKQQYEAIDAYDCKLESSDSDHYIKPIDSDHYTHSHIGIHDYKLDINIETNLLNGYVFRTYNLGKDFCFNAVFLKQIKQDTLIDIVNLGNDVTHEIGQPLHIYDSDKICGTVIIKSSKGGEIFHGLNGKTYTLPSDILIACDDVGIISIIGILGDARTSCTISTQCILLEIVNINAEYMSVAVQKLGINTKSAQLFLHTVDSMAMQQAVVCFEAKLSMALTKEDRIDKADMFVEQKKMSDTIYAAKHAMSDDAITIINAITDASFHIKPISSIARTSAQALRMITIDRSLIAHICGKLWNESDFDQILHKLGFIKCTTSELTYIIPSYRFDIDCPHVLITEYLRMIGYDKLQTQKLIIDEKTDDIKHTLTKRLSAFLSASLHEIVTYKAVDENHINKCSALKMSNPMNNMHYMRIKVLPSVVDMYNEQIKRFRIFKGMYEISDGFEYHESQSDHNHTSHEQHVKQYADAQAVVLNKQALLKQNIMQSTDSHKTLFEKNIMQTLYLGVIMNDQTACWPMNIVNLSSIQAFLQQLLAAAGVDISHMSYSRNNIKAEANPSTALMQTHQYAYIFWKKHNIGIIGALKQHKNAYGFEINLSILMEQCTKSAALQSYVDYQHVYVKDFSIKIADNAGADALLAKASTQTMPFGKDCMIKWSIFDVYPKNILLSRNVGLRAQIYSINPISIIDMNKWYDEMLKYLCHAMSD